MGTPRMSSRGLLTVFITALAFASMANGCQSTAPEVKTLQDAINYLHRYGYLQTDGNIRRSFEKLQYYFGLEPTGKFDKRTQLVMNLPRCGNLDYESEIYPVQFNSLSLKIENFPRGCSKNSSRKWTPKRIHYLLTEGAKVWREVYPSLKIDHGDSPHVEVLVRFLKGYSGASNFDGKGGMLTYGTAPRPVAGKSQMYQSEINFDDAEDWRDDDEGSNFLQMAIHMLGHSLGLGHSNNSDSIMFPLYIIEMKDPLIEPENGVIDDNYEMTRKSLRFRDDSEAFYHYVKRRSARVAKEQREDSSERSDVADSKEENKKVRHGRLSKRKKRKEALPREDTTAVTPLLKKIRKQKKGPCKKNKSGTTPQKCREKRCNSNETTTVTTTTPYVDMTFPPIFLHRQVKKGREKRKIKKNKCKKKKKCKCKKVPTTSPQQDTTVPSTTVPGKNQKNKGKKNKCKKKKKYKCKKVPTASPQQDTTVTTATPQQDTTVPSTTVPGKKQKNKGKKNNCKKKKKGKCKKVPTTSNQETTVPTTTPQQDTTVTTTSEQETTVITTAEQESTVKTPRPVEKFTTVTKSAVTVDYGASTPKGETSTQRNQALDRCLVYLQYKGQPFSEGSGLKTTFRICKLTCWIDKLCFAFSFDDTSSKCHMVRIESAINNKVRSFLKPAIGYGSFTKMENTMLFDGVPHIDYDINTGNGDITASTYISAADCQVLCREERHCIAITIWKEYNENRNWHCKYHYYNYEISNDRNAPDYFVKRDNCVAMK